MSERDAGRERTPYKVSVPSVPPLARRQRRPPPPPVGDGRFGAHPRYAAQRPPGRAPAPRSTSTPSVASAPAPRCQSCEPAFSPSQSLPKPTRAHWAVGSNHVQAALSLTRGPSDCRPSRCLVQIGNRIAKGENQSSHSPSIPTHCSARTSISSRSYPCVQATARHAHDASLALVSAA
jgi:hypothetical protein